MIDLAVLAGFFASLISITAVLTLLRDSELFIAVPIAVLAGSVVPSVLTWRALVAMRRRELNAALRGVVAMALLTATHVAINGAVIEWGEKRGVDYARAALHTLAPVGEVPIVTEQLRGVVENHKRREMLLTGTATKSRSLVDDLIDAALDSEPGKRLPAPDPDKLLADELELTAATKFRPALLQASSVADCKRVGRELRDDLGVRPHAAVRARLIDATVECLRATKDAKAIDALADLAAALYDGFEPVTYGRAPEAGHDSLPHAAFLRAAKTALELAELTNAVPDLSKRLASSGSRLTFAVAAFASKAEGRSLVVATEVAALEKAVQVLLQSGDTADQSVGVRASALWNREGKFDRAVERLVLSAAEPAIVAAAKDRLEQGASVGAIDGATMQAMQKGLLLREWPTSTDHARRIAVQTMVSDLCTRLASGGEAKPFKQAALQATKTLFPTPRRQACLKLARASGATDAEINTATKDLWQNQAQRVCGTFQVDGRPHPYCARADPTTGDARVDLHAVAGVRTATRTLAVSAKPGREVVDVGSTTVQLAPNADAYVISVPIVSGTPDVYDAVRLEVFTLAMGTADTARIFTSAVCNKACKRVTLRRGGCRSGDADPSRWSLEHWGASDRKISCADLDWADKELIPLLTGN